MRTSTRRSTSRSRRIGVVVSLAVVALALGPIAAPAWASAEPPATAVTPKNLEADPKPPTKDVLGAPDASNLIQSDKLLLQENEAPGTADQTDTDTAFTIGSDLPDAKPIVSGIQYSSLVDLHKNYPTASGRFGDNRAERVLALHYGDLGNSAVLALSSPTATLEAQSIVAPVTALPVAGSTIQIQRCEGDFGCSAAWVLTTAPDQADGALDYSYGDGPGDPASYWYVRTPVAGEASTFQFVNGLTGQCLAAAGQVATAAGCSLSSDAVDASQLWQVTPEGQLMSLGSAGGYLTNVFPREFSLAPDTGNRFAFPTIQQAGGVLPTVSVPFPSRDASLASDLATGDLDRAVDADEHYADEAAVAYVDENRALHLAVVDYKGPNGVVTTDTTIAEGSNDYGTVGVEIADFDGDTNNEVAVVHQNADGSAQVDFVAYRSPGTTELLDTSDAPVFAVGANAEAIETFAVTSGEFTGEGGAELSMSYKPRDSRTPIVQVASFDEKFAVKASTTQTISSDNTLYDITQVSGCETEDVGAWCSHAHRLEPALLEVPEGSDDFARRQLVFAWTMAQVDDNQFGSGYNMTPYTCYAALSIAPGATATSMTSSLMGTKCEQLDTTGIVDSWAPELPKKHREPLQLAPGAYNGRDAESGSLPVWGVATLRNAKGSNLSIMTWNSTKNAWDWHYTGIGDHLNLGTLTAYDQDDSSLRLGAPLIVQLTSDESPTVIAAAPPSHVDWIWDVTNDKTDFVNLTAFPDTYLSMGESSTSSFQSASTTEVSGSVGVSAKASVGGTVKEDAIIVSAKTSVDVTAALSGTTTVATQNTKNTFRSTTLSSTSRTVGDDLLRVRSLSQTIYRYPILGGGVASAATDTPCADACFGFYDVAVPTSQPAVQADVGGRSVDWYQPTWLNGNALSYPMSTQEKPGSYTYKDDKQKEITKTDYLFDEKTVFGSQVTTTELKVSDATANNFVTSAKATLKQSVESKQAFKGSVTIGPESGEVRESTDVTVDASEAFGTTQTGTSSTTSDSTFKVGASNSSAGLYGFESFYYYDQAGVAKVTHTVDTGPGTEWWTRTYEATADPALNLPNAINIDADSKLINQVPKFATDFKRQEIRGFETLQPSATGNPADGVKYVSDPVTGDQVTFSVPVHNFSLLQADDTTVEFFAVPVKSDTGDPVGPPEQIGGVKTVQQIAPRGIETVYSDPWTAVGPTGSGSQREWRVFVVLNRAADPATETHSYQAAKAGTTKSNNLACPTTQGNTNFETAAPGTTDDNGFLVDPMTGKKATTACGSNNQGWAELTVQGRKANARSAEATGGTAAAATATVATEPNVRLAGAGFRTDEAEEATLTETSAVPDLAEGVPVAGFVTVDADADSGAHQRVLVYDGLPDEGGTLIASTTLHGASSDEPAYAKYSWTPKTLGRHQLYQKILGEEGAGSSDAQIVTVDVIPEETEIIPTPPTAEPTPGATVPPTVSPQPQPQPQPTSSSSAPASATGAGLANTGLALPVVLTVTMLALLAGIALAIGARRRRTNPRRQE